MNKIFRIILIGLITIGCKNNNAVKKISDQTIEFNMDLTHELKKMAEVDQIAAYILQGAYKKMTKE